MRAKRGLAGAAAVVLLLVSACSGGGDKASTPTGKPAFVPYLDILSGAADIDDIYQKTGQASFVVSFMVANRAGSCVPTWGGDTAIGDSTVKAKLDKIAANGGQVTVATGGAIGTYLETACSSGDLAAAYERVLDVTKSNALDVDIEKTVAPATVTAALATVQKARKTSITLTLPVAGTDLGLTDAGKALLTSAKNAGLDVTVNAMTMNFSADGDWGTSMTTATEAVREDVASVWTGLSDAEIYDMLGVTPMIGVNDTGGTTTLANAQELLTWAQQKGLGFVRFWSVNRDNGGCNDGSVRSDCSGISQDKYAFTSLFAAFRS